MRRAEAQLRGEDGDVEAGDSLDAGNDLRNPHVIAPQTAIDGPLRPLPLPR